MIVQVIGTLTIKIATKKKRRENNKDADRQIEINK